MTQLNQNSRDKLYNLLPAIYRVRDAVDSGQSLRALLQIIEDEMDRLTQDMDGLYNDWFIETCAPWVVPYIGDLLGVRNLHSGDSSGGAFNLRSYVANTLAYRRRKGTAPVLEQLARDVTGWPAHAVEYFERLSTTQHMNHRRMSSLATVNLRDANALELLDGPFESATHTAEVRRIEIQRGKYNIPNLGIFLWRLQSYVMVKSAPRWIKDSLYTFSALGNNIPLFNRPQTETEITHLSEEINVPGVLRRRALYDELEALREMLQTGKGNPPELYFGQQPVLQVFFDDGNTELKPEEIVICDLTDWDQPGWPAPGQTFTKADGTTFSTKVAVDPVLGRLAVLNDTTPPQKVKVSYAYGFSADIGGGSYDRRGTLAVPSSVETWAKSVSRSKPEADFKTLHDALSAWALWSSGAPAGATAIIDISDSDTYQEQISVIMNKGTSLTIQAENGNCPTLRLIDDSSEMADFIISSGDPEAAASLTINGLWIEGGINVEKSSGLDNLNIIHCTLVPGKGLTLNNQPLHPDSPSLVVDPDSNDSLQVSIQSSITGALELSEEITSLSVKDSIIRAESDSLDAGASDTPALVSGNLSSFKKPSAAQPSVNVKIGDEGPFEAKFSGKPNSLAQARDMLQAAIRSADDSSAFARASVTTAGKRLVVIPGLPSDVTITPSSGDASTSIDLKLSGGSERKVEALLSAPLDAPLTLSSSSPEMLVTIGNKGPFIIKLNAGTYTVAGARDKLAKAIVNASAEKEYKDALVGNLDDRLVVLPGAPDSIVAFGPTGNDRSTFMELGLGYTPIAIGAKEGAAGPNTSIERSTIFGSVKVRELTLGSETIFTCPVFAQRRQTGCTRFSFIPEGSRVPRRYRCQPDLALEDYAEKAGKTVALLSEKQRVAVVAENTPLFSSEWYGEPEYGQLSSICPGSILTGAEDGSEMGAFCLLKQPQRRANLAAALEEYLRFGLEAGVFDVALEWNNGQGDNNEG